MSEAVCKFVSSLEEVAPALADPARRKALVDAGLGLADELSTAVMELLRSISRSAGEAVRGRPDETKESATAPGDSFGLRPPVGASRRGDNFKECGMPEEYGILVGVDGSAESDAAVRWATEDVPCSVELRWRPGEHQAALTSSLCTTGPTGSVNSRSRATRSVGRCR